MPPEQETTEDTLSADLSAAWDKAEADDAAAPPEDPSVDPPTEPEAKTEEAPNAEKETETPDGGSEERQSEKDEAEGVPGDGEPAGESAAPAEAGEEPPVGLPPAAREVWKDTPPAMREAIAKREKDFATGVQQYAESAKRAEQMDQALAPYQQYMAIGGGPAQVIPNLLQTASLLQMGSAQQKAQAAADIINQFGVDIATLDSVLVGSPPPTGGDHRVQEQVAAALQPYQDMLGGMQQQQQAQQQQAQQQVQTEVEQFSSDPANEFYNDVKLDMADILDIAANRGQQLTLKDAYERACTMNPQVSAVLAARQNTRSVEDKRKAAVSIAGTPSGQGAGKTPNTVRAALDAAWDSAGRV